MWRSDCSWETFSEIIFGGDDIEIQAEKAVLNKEGISKIPINSYPMNDDKAIINITLASFQETKWMFCAPC